MFLIISSPPLPHQSPSKFIAINEKVENEAKIKKWIVTVQCLSDFEGRIVMEQLWSYWGHVFLLERCWVFQ